ncbi:MFS transporter [Tatumella saanichensis]|uniref:MFS transporter n=1 Tax=Tatumella saanichensis TaxID=480813 RepID=UPI0004A249FB|nr:MFS transporter [Tatumella saanichensis]
MKTGKLLSSPTFAFILLYIGFMISYVDRSAISLSLSHIAKDFNMGPAELGVVLSIFYLGYTVMQIPGGWLADRFGSKYVVITSIALWSVFTVLTGFAWSLTSLLVIRFLFGLGEGGYPSSAMKGIAELYQRPARPKMTGFLISSNYLGSFVAPLLMAPLIIGLGWRDAFFYIGIAGVMFAVIYWFAVPRNNLQASGESDAVQKINRAGVAELLRMPLLWKIMLVWFCLSMVNKGLDAWMPMYLMKARGLDLKTVGFLLPLPFIAASVASAMGGWIMSRWFDGKEKVMLVMSCVLTGIFVYGMYQSATTTEVIVFQTIAYFFKSFVFSVAFALPTKILAQRLVGTGIGIINFGGQAAGFVSPLAIGFIISMTNSYPSAFLFLLASIALAVVISLTFNTKKIREVQLAQAQKA